MSHALVPVSRHQRPTILAVRGGHVYVSVRDAEFQRQKAQWKQRLARAHPDAGGSVALFRRVSRVVDAWLASEQCWYGQWGLPVPGSSVVVTAPRRPRALPKIGDVLRDLARLDRRVSRRPRRQSRQAIRTAYQARLLAASRGGAATAAEAAATLGITPHTFQKSAHKYGVPYLRRPAGNTVGWRLRQQAQAGAA